MVAVLVCSERIGRSCWAAVRGKEVIQFRGLGEGDLVRVSFRKEEEIEIMEFDSDGKFPIPEGTLRIRAEHVEASGSPIFIDLR